MTSVRCPLVELSDGGPAYRVADLPVPEDGLVVRVLAAGLCRSDVKEVSGARPIRSDFGHEFVGIIDGRSRSDAIRAGTLVVFDPHAEIDRTSGFAAYVVAAGPAKRLREAFRVLERPGEPERLIFVEPLACAIHACRRTILLLDAGVQRSGSRVSIGVVGAGTAAILQALFLSAEGYEVSLANRGAARLDQFKSSGLAGQIGCHLLDSIGERSFDALLLSTTFSSPELIERSLQLLRDGGVLVLFGGTRPGQVFAGIDVDALRRSEGARMVRVDGKNLVLGGTYGARGSDFSKAIGVARTIPLEKLITEQVTLEDLPARLRSAASGERELLGKTVIRFAQSGCG